MNKSKLKVPRCLPSLISILIVIIGFVWFQILTNSILFFILTWPIWLGEAFGRCLAFMQKSYFNQFIGLFSFSLLAFILYRLKKGSLVTFGIIEFVDGVFVIWGSLNTPSDNNLTNAIALGAGLFLMVQGAEDYSEEP